MNKMKFSILLLVSAIIMIFSSCGGMMTETDDVSIDLTSVVSRAAVDGVTVNHAKVWLVAEGTNNLYDLPDSESSYDLSDGNIVKLTNIPVGPTYRVYMSLGNKTTANKFTIKKTVTGKISVTGGATTSKTFSSTDIKTNLFTSLVGTPVTGTAFSDGKVFTAAADGTKLYYGTSGAMDNVTASGIVFKDVDKGYDGNVIVTAKAEDGKAVGTVDSSGNLDFSFSTDLPEEMFGETLPDNTTIDLLSSFIYYDEDSSLQLGISQMDGGIVLSVYGTFNDGESEVTETQWMPVDFSEALEALEEFDISLDGKFFKSFAVMKQADSVHLFVASKIGNYKISVPFEDGVLGELDGDILEVLEDFVTDNATLGDKIILNLGNSNNTDLFVGTDSGLFRMKASDMTEIKAYATGERIELLKTSEDYTAAVTALKLIVINNTTGKTAAVAFNEGLPTTGLLNNGGITGLDWAEDTLYISGNYGLAELDVSTLTFK